jgi:transcriptional regulator with XRE-family HTH domain
MVYMDSFNVKTTIAEKVKKLRIENKLHQRELASILGVSPANISKYERGEIEIRYDALIKLSKYFNVSIDYLFGLKDSRNISDNFDNYYDYIKVIEKSIPEGLTADILNMLVDVWRNSKK